MTGTDSQPRSPEEEEMCSGARGRCCDKKRFKMAKIKIPENQCVCTAVVISSQRQSCYVHCGRAFRLWVHLRVVLALHRPL